ANAKLERAANTHERAPARQVQGPERVRGVRRLDHLERTTDGKHDGGDREGPGDDRQRSCPALRWTSRSRNARRIAAWLRSNPATTTVSSATTTPNSVTSTAMTIRRYRRAAHSRRAGNDRTSRSRCAVPAARG